MSQPADDASLRAALEQVLAEHGETRPIARVARRPSAYGSSFALEELDVALDDGTCLRLMFKDMSGASLLAEARSVKPAFLHDPRREIETYRVILAPAGLGTATFYGAVCDASADRHWLFVERIPGVELYQVGEFDIWIEVARWLARMHARFLGEAETLAELVPLVRHNASSYRRWMTRARSFLRDTQLPARQRRKFERLADGYDRVVTALQALPTTFIHGDFFAANVLVQQTPAGPRICPVDWEMAAAGPGLIDLAALMAGNWSEDRRRRLAMAYRRELPPSVVLPTDMEAFLTALDCCRLHLAVQWLGWARNWSPPSAQAQDWLAEALALAARLGV